MTESQYQWPLGLAGWGIARDAQGTCWYKEPAILDGDLFVTNGHYCHTYAIKIYFSSSFPEPEMFEVLLNPNFKEPAP